MCARGKRSDFQSDSKKEMNVATRKASGATHEPKQTEQAQSAWLSVNLDNNVCSDSQQIIMFCNENVGEGVKLAVFKQIIMTCKHAV